MLQLQPRAPDQVRQAPGGLAVDLFEVQVEEAAVLHERRPATRPWRTAARVAAKAIRS